MRVLLVRHGETPWNAEGRYQGQIDIPLSATGEQQAHSLQQRLLSVPIDRAVASPLQRARATAQIALGERAGLLSVDAGLGEIAHGTWEGKLASEIDAEDPMRFRAWREAPETVQMPGGESLTQVFERVWPAFARAVEGLRADQTALVVAHDAVNRLILCKLLGLPFAQLWRFRQAPATMNLLEGPSAERLDIVRLNDCAHHTALFGEAVHRAL
jgi:probable phosphoglycerate mutase